MIKKSEVSKLPHSGFLIARLVVISFLLGIIFAQIQMLWSQELPHTKESVLYAITVIALILTIKDMRSKIDRIRLLGKMEE